MTKKKTSTEKRLPKPQEKRNTQRQKREPTTEKGGADIPPRRPRPKPKPKQ